jgi:hypothetical protein
MSDEIKKLKAAADAAAHAYEVAADAADGAEPDDWAAADVAWDVYEAAYNAWLSEFKKHRIM